MKQISIFSLVIFFILLSCNLPDRKELKFSKNQQEVLKELMKLKKFENAKIGSAVSGYGDTVIYSLKIYLINGKNMPSEDTTLRKIGKDALNIVFKSLENKNDFTNFTVLFVTDKRFGSVRTLEELPFEYKIEEF